MNGINRLRAQFTPLMFTFLRIYVGVNMTIHGWSKFQNFEQTKGFMVKLNMPLPDISAVMAVLTELAGGLGLIVGLMTPVAALGVFAAMSIAVFKVHWASGFSAKDGGFEYPLTLWMCALYFMFAGGGKISLDRLFFRKRS